MASREAVGNQKQQQQQAIVRQVKPQNFQTQRAPNGAKTNLKTNLVSEVTQTARHSNYGQRHQHRNNNQLQAGAPQQQSSTAEQNPLSTQQSSTVRTYASSKPLQRRVARRSKGATEPATQVQLVESQPQKNRALSRRQMPSHLFHPAAPGVAAIDYSTHMQEGSQTNLLTLVGHEGCEPASQQLFGKQPGVASTTWGKQAKISGAVIQISREHIKPPPSNNIKVAAASDQSSSVRRGSSILKRSSVLTQRANQTLGKNNRTAARRASNSNLHETEEHYPHLAADSIEVVQGQNSKQVKGMWKLGQQQSMTIDQERLAQLQRKNSSLSRRDYQIHIKQQQQALQGANSKRRKSSSNPRQKISSTLRTIQPSTTQAEGKIRVQRVSKPNVSVPQKYGYRNGNGNGPLEAYTTNKTYSNGQVVFTSVDSQTQGITKRMSANQIPTAFHVSRDVNPMHLQHINSVDRAASLDSACYEVNLGNAQAAQPISIRVTPKSGTSQEQRQAHQIRQGFSHLLKQTILAQAKENQIKQKSLMSIPEKQTIQHAELEAALLSLDKGQLTQNMMSEFINMKSEGLDSSRKLSAPIQNQEVNANSRLETLIQQHIVRKEITQSPNIQQRRGGYYNSNQITAAHQSLQAAHQLGDQVLGKRTVQQITHFANSLHNSNVLKQEHSAEDLLRIGRQNDSAFNQSPQRSLQRITAAKKNSQQRLQKPQVLKSLRPTAQEGSNINVQEFNQQQNADSFGQLSGIRPQGSISIVTQGNNLNQTGLTGIDLNLSDTFGFPSCTAGQTQPIGQQRGGIQTLSVNVDEVKEVQRSQQLTTGEANNQNDEIQSMTVMQTIDPTSLNTLSQMRGNENEQDASNAQVTMLSLEQPQMQKTTLGSDGSVDDVYHKTLYAYQNDMNTLNQINRTRREISDRILQHQNILKSIQGASKLQGAPQSASAVLMDSVTNNSIGYSKEMSITPNLPRPSEHEQVNMLMQPLAMSNPPLEAFHVDKMHHYNTMIAADDSHQYSFLESQGASLPVEYASLQGISLEPAIQQQTLAKMNVTTSPIVGRYRLKHVAAQSQVPASSKRQQAYDGQLKQLNSQQPQLLSTRMAQSIGDKRNKSVRPKRPTGQHIGGSNMRGGGRRMRDEQQKQRTMGVAVRNKFDSIAQAYNSSQAQTVSGIRDDYHSNSEQNFAGGGLASMIIAAGPNAAQQLQQQQLVSQGASRRQIQTLEPATQRSVTLQQTYGVTQKLAQPGQSSVKRSQGVGSVPRQRQGVGFSSNMRPPQGAKQTERSLSHNRNRAQHSFQQMNSIAVQHTFMGAGSGSVGSQHHAQIRQLHGSVQYQPKQGNALDPTTISGSYVEGAAQPESIDVNSSAISPIATQPNRSLKYRAKQVPAAHSKPRQGKSKSTSRGRGAVVANSTQFVGPNNRKHSRIVSRVLPSNRDGGQKQTQLSQQQVMHFRGSLLPQQTGPIVDTNNSMRVSMGAKSGENQLVDVVSSPQRKTVQQKTFDAAENITPETLKDLSPEYKPSQHLRLKLLNKITRANKDESVLESKEEEVLAQEMSVGGQEIGATTTSAIPPVTRTHNLRYSSAVNDFTSQDDRASLAGDVKALPSNDANSRPRTPTEMSQAAKDRQNQAMKLINEDNPFENPQQVKQQTAFPRSSIAMLGKVTDGDPNQAMSFVADDSSKSIADKTTERESKNTNATLRTGGCVSISAAASTTLTNQFKSTQKRTISLWGASNFNAAASNQQHNTGSIPQRRSLLGLAALRRSETTEDSQQCLYNDGAMLMSSLPMPMHSIRQVIAEEEPGDEQDERTTNKESNQILTTNGKGSSGNTQAAGQAPNPETSGNQSSGQGEGAGMGDTPKMSSSDNVELITGKQQSERTNPENSKLNELSITDEVKSDRVAEAQKFERNLLDDDSVCQGEESGVFQTPNLNKLDVEKVTAPRPLSQKQSARYSTGDGYDQSARGNNLLCESEGSVLRMEDSVKINEDFTPEALAAKNQNKTLPKPCKTGEARQSYNRGAFQPIDSSKLLADFPPQLSDSSISRAHRKSQDSQAHSDDEVEVRRGLESEKARSDMGSNPELCQSTKSLQLKPTKAMEEEEKFGSLAADQMLYKKQTQHCDESRENLMTDEIEIDVDLNRASIERAKPAHQARNNNYLVSQKPKAQLNQSRRQSQAKLESEIDDEEEVGGFDDAEEFKLGKLI